jgi:hypothetical protein
MMKRFVLLMLNLLLSLSLWATPALAQDNDLDATERGLIEDVLESYAALLSQATFRASLNSTITQDISAGGMTIMQEIAQTGEIQTQTDGASNIIVSYARLEQTTTSSGLPMGAPNDGLVIVTETFMRDGATYLRYGGDLAAMGGLPTTWTEITENFSVGGVELGAMAVFSSPTDSLALYPLSVETVASIEELPQTTLENGQTVRVIRFVYDNEGMAQTALFQGLASAFQGMEGGNFAEDILAAVTYTQTVYISTKDGLPLRVEVESGLENLALAIQGANMRLTQAGVSQIDYFGFNEALDLPTAP